MKKIFFLMILFALLKQVNAEKPITIVREKIGGNKTDKFNKVDRKEIEGETKITVSIQCVDPGENSCPTAKFAATSSEGTGCIDPALANAIEYIFSNSDDDFKNGDGKGAGNTTLAIATRDGSIRKYYVEYSWDDKGGIQRCTVQITPAL